MRGFRFPETGVSVGEKLRLYFPPAINVDEGEGWSDVILRNLPETSRHDPIFRVGRNGVGTEDLREVSVLLANFSLLWTGETPRRWAKSRNLRPASPRTVFNLIGQEGDLLRREYGLPIFVVSLQDFPYQGRPYWCEGMIDQAVGDEIRVASLRPADYLPASNIWYVFVPAEEDLPAEAPGRNGKAAA